MTTMTTTISTLNRTQSKIDYAREQINDALIALEALNNLIWRQLNKQQTDIMIKVDTLLYDAAITLKFL